MGHCTPNILCQRNNRGRELLLFLTNGRRNKLCGESFGYHNFRHNVGSRWWPPLPLRGAVTLLRLIFQQYPSRWGGILQDLLPLFAQVRFAPTPVCPLTVLVLLLGIA